MSQGSQVNWTLPVTNQPANFTVVRGYLPGFPFPATGSPGSLTVRSQIALFNDRLEMDSYALSEHGPPLLDVLECDIHREECLQAAYFLQLLGDGDRCKWLEWLIWGQTRRIRSWIGWRY